MHEHRALPVQLSAHVIVGQRQRVQAMLHVALPGRSVVGERNATIAHAQRPKLLCITTRAVVDRKHRAEAARAQLRGRPGALIGSGAARECTGHQPEYMLHIDRR